MNAISYIIINPYKKGYRCGISTYCENLFAQIKDLPNIKAIILQNSKNLSIEGFQKYVQAKIESGYYDPNNTIIEAPEVRSSSILLSKKWKVHIRLHCPSLITSILNHTRLNNTLNQSELAVIRKAAIISAPSEDMVNIMPLYYDGISKECLKSILVYPNPISIIHSNDNLVKKYDVIFMAHFRISKGIEYLNQILKLLPSNYHVLLMGQDSKSFKLEKSLKCKVSNIGYISTNKRLKYLAESKCLINLSKFESFGFSIFESLMSHTMISSWASESLKKLIPSACIKYSKFEDTEIFARNIQLIVDIFNAKKYPGNEVFDNCIEKINKDFRLHFKNLIKMKKKNCLQNIDIKADIQIQSNVKLANKYLSRITLIRKMCKLIKNPKLFFFDMFNHQ